MKRGTLVVIAALAMCLHSHQASSDPPEQSPTQQKITPLMQLKLDKSKQILEGLALEDFDKIGKNARSLKLLSMESGWKVIQTEEYAKQSRDFRRTCDLIAEAAADKDTGRAALGYVAMTVRCVECHAYMRKHRTDLARRGPTDKVATLSRR
jgi:hypothetical protein